MNQPLQLTQVSQIIELSIILCHFVCTLGRRKRKLFNAAACQIEAAVLNKANSC